MSDMILSMKGITKKFPGVVALDHVDFQLRRGEMHALVGENGAGKSTLMKVLGGVYLPNEGTIEINGRETVIAKPSDSIANKVGVIYQEFNLVPTLNVAENMFLGREKTKGAGHLCKAEMEQQAEKAMEQLGISNFDTRTKVKFMSVAMQQLVEIGKAVFDDIEILVMDEPTAVLTEKETEGLFEIVHRLKEKGMSIIYISHRLEEVIALCDRMTVLRDGKVVETIDNQNYDTEKDYIVSKMVGRELGNYFPPKMTQPSEEIALEVRGLTKAGMYEDIHFQARRGEILGISGLVGSGRTEIMKSIFGVIHPDSGEILMDGCPVVVKNPNQAKQAGIALVPEDRKREGVVLGMSLKDNICLPNHDKICSMGRINRKKRDALAEQYIQDLQIRPADAERQIKNFSGGNQQKGVIAKWLAAEPKVMILDEPTRGIDVGAKVEIYNIINTLAANSTAVIVVSSELLELLGICDRILVVNNGRISGEFDREHFSQDAIMKASFNMGGTEHGRV